MLPFLWLTLPFLIFKTLLAERIVLKSFGNIFLPVAPHRDGFLLLYPLLAYDNDVILSIRLAAAWAIAVLLALIVNYFPKRDNFAFFVVFYSRNFS
jgi:hypothetical protein